MRIVFWFFLVLWVFSVGARWFVVGLSGYAGSPLNAFWGSRFIAYHFLCEATVVVMTGYWVHYRPEIGRGYGTTFGLVALVVLVILHVASMSLEIGYKVRETIAGQPHVVDWIYSPGKSTPDHRLTIRVSYPGYRPMHRDKTWRDLRVTISKSEPERSYFSAAFKTAADKTRPECIEEPYNRYCRFFVNGAWYMVHHQTLSNSPEGPSLEAMINEIPALFDTFVVQP